LFLTLFHRVYAPFSTAMLQPLAHAAILREDRRSALDQLYAGVDHALDQLLDHLGVSLAA
jgi:hypothetical protein